MTASFADATFENVWNQAKENKNHIAPCPSVQRGGRQRAQAMVCTFCLPKGCNPRIPAYPLTVGGGNLENRIRPYGTAPCGQPCRENIMEECTNANKPKFHQTQSAGQRHSVDTQHCHAGGNHLRLVYRQRIHWREQDSGG